MHRTDPPMSFLHVRGMRLTWVLSSPPTRPLAKSKTSLVIGHPTLRASCTCVSLNARALFVIQLMEVKSTKFYQPRVFFVEFYITKFLNSVSRLQAIMQCICIDKV